jgi:hypothetical protein
MLKEIWNEIRSLPYGMVFSQKIFLRKKMKMKKLIYYFLPLLSLVFACDKSESGDLSSPTVSGSLNGAPVDFTVILSDVISSNGSETAYIVMRRDFEGFNKPSSNGKQLLIRIEPYTGKGSYQVNSNSFWVFEEEINISGGNFSSTLHRFSSDETSGSMKVEITEDAIKQGKRTLVGSFEGINGITEKVTSTGSQSTTLKSMEFKNITFVAPEGAL